MIQPKLLASGLCLFFLSGAVLAQRPEAAAAEKIQPVIADDIAEKIRNEGLMRSKVMDHLDHLTHKIGHRLTGSDNYDKAARWALGQFHGWGLEARLEKWGEWKVRWNRGKWEGRLLSPGQMDLKVATSAWTAGTKGKVQGPLIPMPKDLDEVDELGKKLRGAWLLDTRRRAGFGMPRGPSPLEEALAEEGIAGYVKSSRGTGDRRYPNQIRVFGNNRIALSPNLIPKIPVVVVRADQFDELRKLVEASDDGRGNQAPEVRVEFHIENHFKVEPVPLYNVIAEIKGTGKPDEFVGVGGHLDSWHQAQGATDNGTGAATTLEAARILAAVGVKPKRTIRFCLWSGEEQGLMGSTAHVRRHRQEMDKFSAYLNHDTGTNWCHAVSVTEAMYPAMQRVMAPVMTMQPPDKKHEGPVFKLVKTRGMRGGGSDHGSFLAAGVPAWSWGLKGRAVYAYGWHSQWDNYDIAIPDYQRHTATVIALAALGIADLPDLLSREGLRAGGGQGRRRGRQAGPILEAYLGVELKDGGLVIHSVSKDSLAKKSGLEPGDEIVKFNGKDVRRAWQVTQIIRDSKAPWTMTVKRGKGQVKIKLGSAEPSGPRRRL